MGTLSIPIRSNTGQPLHFVLLLPFVFLAWGEIYALFSALTGDVFGPKYATSNYGMLYTAKGLAAILAGWGAALVAEAFAGSFHVPFYVAATFDCIAAVLAFFALRPLVEEAVRGKDVIVHTAWSFVDDPCTVIGEDIKGHINVLGATTSSEIRSLLYTSTPTVYGRTISHPVTETHPCLVGDARTLSRTASVKQKEKSSSICT